MENATVSPVDIVDGWNADNPEGTAVAYYRTKRNDGRLADRVSTKTRSRAWLLNNEPVIMVDGISGCVHLAHVFTRRPQWIRINRRGMVSHWVPLGNVDAVELQETVGHLQETDARVVSIETSNTRPSELSQ